MPGSKPFPETDAEGFLRHIDDWNENVAELLAAGVGIALEDGHWEVIRIARNYYESHAIFPANRVLISRMKQELGEDKGDSIYLMGLFTGKPRRHIALIAGLPKPSNCD